MPLWLGIDSVPAGVFGVSAGIAAKIIVSLVTKRPSPKSLEFIVKVRQTA